jgi:hypothetical protein
MGSVSELVSRGVRVLFAKPGFTETEIPADFFDSSAMPMIRSALPVEVEDFAGVYDEARVPAPAAGYGVDKLAEILESTRLAALPREVKIAAVLASLDAAGATLADVIRDAVLRDRALDDFLAAKEREVKALEARNDSRIESLRDEVESFAGEREIEIARLREAADRVSGAFRQLQLRTRQETERLYDVVGHFVDASDNPIPAPGAQRRTRPAEPGAAPTR